MTFAPGESPAEEYERRLADRTKKAKLAIARTVSVWFGAQLAAAVVFGVTLPLVAWVFLSPGDRTAEFAELPRVLVMMVGLIGVLSGPVAAKAALAALRDWPVLTPAWIFVALTPWFLLVAELLWLLSS